jgi:hypothetical protein
MLTVIWALAMNIIHFCDNKASPRKQSTQSNLSPTEAGAILPWGLQGGFTPLAMAHGLRDGMIPSTDAVPTPTPNMLDNNIHKCGNNLKDWNSLTVAEKRLKRKKGRYYHALMSGLLWNRYEEMYFLTLTSADKVHPLERDWHYLTRMIQDRYGKIEYCKLQTSEGNGVLHIVMVSPRIDVTWLREKWDKRHNARQLRIDPVEGSERLVQYLLGQYLNGQDGYIRHDVSQGWIYPGYRKDFLYLVK